VPPRRRHRRAPQDRAGRGSDSPPATDSAPAAAAAATAAHPDAPGENPFGNPPHEATHLVRKLQLVDRGDGTRLLVLAGRDVEMRLPLDNLQLLQILRRYA
jgi:hypothetical protein